MAKNLVFFLILSLFLISCSEEEDSEYDIPLGIVTDGQDQIKNVSSSGKESANEQDTSSDTVESTEPKKIKERICTKSDSSPFPTGPYIRPFKATMEIYGAETIHSGSSSLDFACSVKYELIAHVRTLQNVHEIRVIEEETKHASKMEECEKYISEKVTEHRGEGYTC